MGLFDWFSSLFKPVTSCAGGLFNEATDHWQLQQGAAIRDDTGSQLKEIAEVVGLCQKSLAIDHKMGDAYVMLSNALILASVLEVSRPADADLLRRYAAAVICRWSALPNNKYPVTKNYKSGLYFYEQIMDQIVLAEQCGRDEAQEMMESYAREYADQVLGPSAYSRVARLLWPFH